jgi:hypothetical protein
LISLIIQTGCFSTGGTCDDCGHLLLYIEIMVEASLGIHEGGRLLPRPSRLSSVSHPDISPRVDTASKLAGLLEYLDQFTAASTIIGYLLEHGITKRMSYVLGSDVEVESK